MPKTLPNLKIRLMFHRDLSKVLEIERGKAGPTWTRRDFVPVFREDDAEGWVAEVEDEVVGFVVFRHAVEAGRRRRIVLNFGVAPAWRRQGVGRSLFRRLAEKLRSSGDCVRVTVPESNLTALLFLRGIGYKAVQVLHSHFDPEDGYLMEKRRG